MLFVFIYLYWRPIRFPYQMMFVSFSSNTTGVTSGARTSSPSGAHEFPTGFSGTRVARSWTLCIVFPRSLFVLFILVVVFSSFPIYGFWIPLWYLEPFLRISLIIFKNLQMECFLHYWRRVLPFISLLSICVTFFSVNWKKCFHWWLLLDYKALHLLMTSLATSYCP